MTDFVDAADLFAGLHLAPLPDGAVPLDAVCLIKALDADGEVGWYTRYTEDLHAVEALGALTAGFDLQRDHVAALYEPDE